jgi:hypothetical protein
MKHPVIRTQKHRIIYKSFLAGEESDTIEEAKDTCGHGTHCAALLLEFAQNATILVGRITSTDEMKGADLDSIVKVRLVNPVYLEIRTHVIVGY